jgi:hypothetical protein
MKGPTGAQRESLEPLENSLAHYITPTRDSRQGGIVVVGKVCIYQRVL